MKKRFLDTEAWKILRTAIEILLIAVAVWFVIWAYTALGFSEAKGEGYSERYAVCRPDDVVIVRERPKKTARAISELAPGQAVTVDGIEKNGYVHCIEMGSESGDGWVYGAYLVYEPPREVYLTGTVVSNGRLAARRWIGGPRVRWLKPMAEMRVYYLCGEWAVTSRGYVRSEFLELGCVEDD